MKRLLRHGLALLAAIALTLIFLEFWGRFSGAMVHVVEIRAQKPMPVTVIPAKPATDCAKEKPCPVSPNRIP